MNVRSNAELGCNLPLHEEKNESHNAYRPPKYGGQKQQRTQCRKADKRPKVGPINLPKKTAVARTKQSMSVKSRTHRAIATAEDMLLGAISESRKFNERANSGDRANVDVVTSLSPSIQRCALISIEHA